MPSTCSITSGSVFPTSTPTLAGQGFGSLNFNPNGGPDGGFGTANIITDGIGRRRLQLGAKIIF